MTSIRAQIDAHTPILAQTVPDREGFVQVEIPDYEELLDIARSSGPNVYAHDDQHVVLKAEDFDRLVHEAHDALHPAQPTAGGLFDAIFGAGQHHIETPEVPEDDSNYRSAAMHYAVAVVTTKIQAAHGLDTETPDVVAQAKEILAFLKG